MVSGSSANHAQRSRSEGRADTLLAVAASLFRKHGYHGVSINDIAAAAGVTGPAVYRHFRGKQQLLERAVLTELAALEQVSTLALSGEASAAGRRLSTLTKAIASLAVERRDVAALWRWQGGFLPHDVRSDVKSRGGRVLDGWARTLREHRPELAGPDAELLCWAALSVFGSVADHRSSLGKRALAAELAVLADVILASAPPRARAGARGDAATRGGALLRGTRREELLAAASRLFRERGFHAVSISDIGRAAGLAPASVYRHYPSKTALLVTACRRMADRLATDAAAAIRAACDDSAALHELLRSYVDHFGHNRDLVTVYVTELPQLPGAERAELLRLQRAYVAQWVELLCKIHPGMPEPFARVRVHAALGIVNDLTRTGRLHDRTGLDRTLVVLGSRILDSEYPVTPL